MTCLPPAAAAFIRHARTAFARRARTAAATAAVLALAGGTLLAGAAVARAASITVTPDTGSFYTFSTFTLSGNVDPDEVNDNVMVTFNNANLGSVEVQSRSTGAFSVIFTLPLTDINGNPATPHCGANTVTATAVPDIEADDSVTGGTLVGSATIDLSCASITATPSVVGNQQLPAPFEVTPQNFPSPGGFTLTIDGTPQAFAAAADGGLDFTSSPACGAHQVVLSQTFNGQPVSASTQITVLCPQITLSPATITLASEPATVVVTGTQFHPGQPVTISLNGKDVGSTVTDEDGSFSLPITAAGLDCAAHQITASEQANAGGPAFLLSATAPLQVTACQQALAIDPAVLQPGELTHVTGAGFAPATPVTLSWQPSGGGPPLPGTLTVTAGNDGSISAFFMVLPGDLLGARQLAATQDSLNLTASAIVDAGPMQPVSAGQLVYRQ